MAFLTQSFQWNYSGTLLSYGIGDFNGDGVVDLAFGGPETPFVNEVRPFGIMSFHANGVMVDTTNAIMVTVPYAIHPGEMFVGDFNGDGVSDFFSGNSGFDDPTGVGERNTLMLSSGGKLVDASASLPPFTHFTHSVTGGDIDNDGDLDLFVGVLGWESFEEKGAYFLINDGKGNFTKGADAPDSVIGSRMTTRMLECHLADINGDGWLDLIGGYDQNGLTAGVTFLNDGTGNFSEESKNDLPVGLYGSGEDGKGTIVTGIIDMDVNQDGHKDLIVAQTAGHPFYQGQKIQILVNDGAGKFRDETTSRITQDGVGFWSQDLKAVDFNGDGHLDILAQSDMGYASERTIIWLNDGGGRFSPAPMFMTGGFEGGVVPVDFNRDGRMDYVSFVQEGGWLGTGRWTVKTHLNIPDPVTPPKMDEYLSGTKGKDWLTGGEGNDKLYGGYGNDTLTGLGGQDVFVFNSKLGTYKTDRKVNFDTITDFKPGEDKLWLDNAIFKKLGKKGNEASPATLNKKFFKIGSKAGDKDDYILYNKKTGVLSYDADGKGSKKAVEFARIDKNLKLSSLDFLII